MKKLFMSALLLVASASFATTTLDIADYGSAFHSGTGKVLHDGDFIEFNVNFEAACYQDRNQAWDYVTDNVAIFQSWLDLVHDQSGQNISWDIDPINISRNEYGYENGCNQTYSAYQSLKITLNKTNGTQSLEADAIQSFYASLQLALWPLSHTEAGDVPSRVTSSITSVEKGIWEETADSLRILAKSKARTKATNDFLAFLGPDYSGRWFLQSVDFRDAGYTQYKVAVGAADSSTMPAPALPGGGMSPPSPAELKLQPLTVSVTGSFHFVFDIRYGANR